MGPGNTVSRWGQATQRVGGARQHSGTRQRKESVGPNNTENWWGQTTQKTSGIRQHRESKENQRGQATQKSVGLGSREARHQGELLWQGSRHLANLK